MKVGTKVDVITNSSTEVFLIETKDPKETARKIETFIRLAESWGHDDMVASVEILGKGSVEVVSVEDNSMPRALTDILKDLGSWDNNVLSVKESTI